MPCQLGLVEQFDIPYIVVTLQIHGRNNPDFDSEDVALLIFDHHKNILIPIFVVFGQIGDVHIPERAWS